MTSLRHVKTLTVLLGLALAMQRPAMRPGVVAAGGALSSGKIYSGAGISCEIGPGADFCTGMRHHRDRQLGEADVVAPFLAVSDSLRALQISNVNPVELKPLGENQRLVVTAEADGKAVRVFPDEEMVVVSLDLNRPLLEPVMAWTGVDAVVLSPAARARSAINKSRHCLPAALCSWWRGSRSRTSGGRGSA